MWFCFYASVPVFFFLLCSISVPGLEAKHKTGHLVVEGPWGDGTLFQTLTSTTLIKGTRGLITFHTLSVSFQFDISHHTLPLTYFHFLCGCVNRGHSLCSLWTKLSADWWSIPKVCYFCLLRKCTWVWNWLCALAFTPPKNILSLFPQTHTHSHNHSFTDRH